MKTGCPACDEIQRRTGSSTIMCVKCTLDYSMHEYEIARKRRREIALAQRQEENNYIEGEKE